MKIIIANSDVGALLKVADGILKRYDRDVVPESIKGQVVLSVIKDMTEDREYFSICSVDRMAKMNEVEISSEHYQFMSSLHCIKWNNMHRDTKEYLMALLVDYFRGNLVMANAQI